MCVQALSLSCAAHWNFYLFFRLCSQITFNLNTLLLVESEARAPRRVKNLLRNELWILLMDTRKMLRRQFRAVRDMALTDRTQFHYKKNVSKAEWLRKNNNNWEIGDAQKCILFLLCAFSASLLVFCIASRCINSSLYDFSFIQRHPSSSLVPCCCCQKKWAERKTKNTWKWTQREEKY